MSLSIDSPVGDIFDNEGGRAVMEKLYPIDTTNAQYKMSKKMSLKTMSKYPQAKLNAALLGQIDAELKALG